MGCIILMEANSSSLLLPRLDNRSRVRTVSGTFERFQFWALWLLVLRCTPTPVVNGHSHDTCAPKQTLLTPDSRTGLGRPGQPGYYALMNPE